MQVSSRIPSLRHASAALRETGPSGRVSYVGKELSRTLLAPRARPFCAAGGSHEAAGPPGPPRRSFGRIWRVLAVAEKKSEELFRQRWAASRLGRAARPPSGYADSPRRAARPRLAQAAFCSPTAFFSHFGRARPKETLPPPKTPSTQGPTTNPTADLRQDPHGQDDHARRGAFGHD